MLASDMNQIKEFSQTGTKGIKPLDIEMEGDHIYFVGLGVGIRYNGSLNVLEFSNNGTTWSQFASAPLVSVTYGETIAIRDILWIDPADSKAYKTTKSNPDWIGSASEAGVLDDVADVIPPSSIVGGFTGLTVGETYVVSDTAGAVELGVSNVVGIAVSTTQILLIKFRADDLEYAGTGIVQGFYQTLQANNVFENKDFAFADEMTNSSGTNNTVNTGSSTGVWDTDHYRLSETFDTPTQDTLQDDDSAASAAVYTGVSLTVTNDCKLTQVTLQGGVTATSLVRVMVTGGSVIATAAASGGVVDFSGFNVILRVGTRYSIEANPATDRAKLSPSDPYTFTDITVDKTSTNGSDVGMDELWNIFKITTATLVGFDTDDIVVCDTGTLTLDGTEKNIILYSPVVRPTDTDITVDISDGSTTISAQTITNNRTDVIDISSLSSGTLKLTWNLSSTDDSVTPEFFGYAGYIFN